MTSLIETLRESVADKVRTLADLEGVGVFTHKKGDIVANIEGTIAGNTGVMVTVAVLAVREGGSSGTRVDWKDVKLAIDIVENVLINQSETGTRKGAWWLMEAIVAGVKSVEVEGSYLQIAEDEIEEINPAPDLSPNLLVVRVPITTSIAGESRNTTN